MAIVDIVDIPATVLGSLYFGMLYGDAVKQVAVSSLPAESWIAQHRVTAPLLARIMTPLGISAVLFLLFTTAVARGPARWLYALTTLAAIAALLLSLMLAKPLDRSVMAWHGDLPPDSWQSTRNTLVRYRAILALLSGLGLICAAGGLSMA